LKDAMERVQAGVVDRAVIADIVSYALYKLRTGENSVEPSRTKPRERAR
jgi:hypothetical protein